jgi:PhzF family phenazine biosynthesis protein
VCRELGIGGDSLTLEMPAGVIPVRATERTWCLQASSKGWREVSESPAAVAQMLGIGEHEIASRPLWVNTGSEQMIVPLASEAAVRHVKVRAELLEGFASADGQSKVYVFAACGVQLRARFFFPQGDAVLEDPATGSATANLGGWWLAMGRTLPAQFEILQGDATGRPSSLYLRVDAQHRIFVSGEVIELGRGTISLSRAAPKSP